MWPLGGVSTTHSTLLSVLIGRQTVWWLAILTCSVSPPPQFCVQVSCLSVHSPKNLANGLAGGPSGAALADDWASSAEEKAQRNKRIDFETVIRRDSVRSVRAG